MGLFKKKKKNEAIQSVENGIEKRSIQKMEEVMNVLISKGKYYSKPYSLDEIKEILSRDINVMIYVKVDGRKTLLGKIDGEGNVLRKTRYFLDSTYYSSAEEMLKNKKYFGYSLEENWDKVEVIIMLDEKERQVL